MTPPPKEEPTSEVEGARKEARELFDSIIEKFVSYSGEERQIMAEEIGRFIDMYQDMSMDMDEDEG